MQEWDDFQDRVGSGSSEDTPPPADIRTTMDGRRADWFDSLRETEQIRRALAATSEEVQRREQLMSHIFEKLGIQAEVEELRRLRGARSKRAEEVRGRYFREEDR